MNLTLHVLYVYACFLYRHQANGCVIARSSQPLVGMLGWRNPSDEKLLLAFSQSCSLSSSASVNTLTHNGVKINGSSVVGDMESMGLSGESSEDAFLQYQCENEVSRMKVFDLRSYTAALGNRAKGGGCECTGVCVYVHLCVCTCICVCVYVHLCVCMWRR